jgi:glycine/D-amino acid oxidase-like deaminating enzyme
VKDVIIIGAGLFGSIAAAALRSKGADVMVIDDKRPMSGSSAAACLMKPSWLNSLSKEQQNGSLELLSNLYDLKTLQFDTPIGKAPVWWVSPQQILKEPDLLATVVQLQTGTTNRVICRLPEISPNPLLGTQPTNAALQCYDAKAVIVCCGVWSNQFFEDVAIESKIGVSFRVGRVKSFRETMYHDGLIRPWAPYKQIVAFDIAPKQIWIGDGTAIKAKNWSDGYLSASRSRCLRVAGIESLGQEVIVNEGKRPYMKTDEPCFLKEMKPGIWINSGGAKNGTIAAAWAADQLVRRLT